LAPSPLRERGVGGEGEAQPPHPQPLSPEGERGRPPGDVEEGYPFEPPSRGPSSWSTQLPKARSEPSTLAKTASTTLALVSCCKPATPWSDDPLPLVASCTGKAVTKGSPFCPKRPGMTEAPSPPSGTPGVCSSTLAAKTESCGRPPRSAAGAAGPPEEPPP